MKNTQGQFFICFCGVYGVYSFALSQFFYFVDVPSPQHCKSLALVLHCFRFLEHCIAIAAKTPPALFHRSYRCYIYATPLGSGLPQFCLPPCPKVLKNLKGVKLGQKQKCGNVSGDRG